MREFHVDIPLGRIAGLRNGGGSDGANVPRVLALHGWLDNAASFIPLASQLHGIDQAVEGAEPTTALPASVVET